MSNIDAVFAGSVPELYDSHLVPLLFEPYAEDMQRRVAALGCTRVLEVAAGTGVVTRALAALPSDVSVVATDLNQAMLDRAAAVGTVRPVTWQRADALALPFPDQSFDVVVCQFGVMFFPDKAKAFAEARRVLQPGGCFVFSVWDRIAENEFADAITTSLVEAFPEAPPRFLARTPHGYYERALIERDLAAGGFTTPPRWVTLAARSVAASARLPAIAYCQGTPLRHELEARGALALGEATDLAANAIAARFGTGPVDGKIRAHVVTVEA